MIMYFHNSKIVKKTQIRATLPEIISQKIFLILVLINTEGALISLLYFKIMYYSKITNISLLIASKGT